MSAIGDNFDPGLEPTAQEYEETMARLQAEEMERRIDEKNEVAEKRAANLPHDQQDLAAALRGDNPVYSPASPHE